MLRKTSSLPPIAPNRVTWFELKSLDATWLDWQWANEKLIVWVYELGWVECEYPECETNKEELRSQLEEKWIAAHYADMAYFTINLCCKGKHDA